MVADVDIVRERCQRIRRYVSDLRDMSDIELEAFRRNRERQYAVLHALPQMMLYYAMLCLSVAAMRVTGGKPADVPADSIAYGSFGRTVSRRLFVPLLLGGMVLAFAGNVQSSARLREIHILDTGILGRGYAVPTVCLIQRGGTATIINAGDRYMAERIIFRLLCEVNALRVTKLLNMRSTARHGLAGARTLAAMTYVDRIFAPPGAIAEGAPKSESLSAGEAVITAGDATVRLIPSAGAARNTPEGIESYLALIDWRGKTMLVVSDVHLGVRDGRMLLEREIRADVLVLPAAHTRGAAELERRRQWMTSITEHVRPEKVIFSGSPAPWMVAAVEAAGVGYIIDTGSLGAIRIRKNKEKLQFEGLNRGVAQGTRQRHSGYAVAGCTTPTGGR